jgi:hypothetical protein
MHLDIPPQALEILRASSEPSHAEADQELWNRP